MRARLWVGCCAMLAACGPGTTDSDSPTDSDPPISTDSDTAEISDTATTALLRFVEEPAITANPNPRAPLAQIITAKTSQPTRLEVAVTGGAGPVTHLLPELATDHDATLVGLRAATPYSVQVTAVTEAGERLESAAIAVQQPALPPQFPPFTVAVSDPERMEPGYTIFVEQGTDRPNPSNYVIIVDPQGEVVWYLDTRVKGPSEVHMTDEGHLRILSTGAYDLIGQVVELDFRGGLIRRWRPASQAEGDDIPLPVEHLHHDVQPAPGGGLFFLSVEPYEEAMYPSSESNRSAPLAPATVIGDVVVEVGPDGSLLNRWELFRMVDPDRIGYDSLQGRFWEPEYGPDVKDWAHANAVFYDEPNDALLVSLRHQDSIVKFSRATGELIWILGDRAHYSPEFDPYLLEKTPWMSLWHYHQHAVEVLPNGNILMFDNGNNRASAFRPKVPDSLNFSRALEYAIDEEAWTATPVWTYGTPIDQKPYSYMAGDADYQPITGNVLTTFSAIGSQGDANVTWELVETTHTTPPEVVFQVLSAPQRNWTPMYRAERVPALMQTL